MVNGEWGLQLITIHFSQFVIRLLSPLRKVLYRFRFRAKALIISRLPYPSLKAGVIENQLFMDFSPKCISFRSGLII